MLSQEHRIARLIKKYGMTTEQAVDHLTKLDKQYAKTRIVTLESIENKSQDVFKGNQELKQQMDCVTFSYISIVNTPEYTPIGNGYFVKTVVKSEPIITEYKLCPETKQWIRI